MRKTLTALVTAGAIAIATVATPNTAHARWGWWGGAALGGLFAGALIASAFASPYYGYGYPAYMATAMAIRPMAMATDIRPITGMPTAIRGTTAITRGGLTRTYDGLITAAGSVTDSARRGREVSGSAQRACLAALRSAVPRPNDAGWLPRLPTDR